MSGIHIAATILSLFALATFAVVVWMTRNAERWRLWTILLVAMLPMNALAYHGVRMPVDHFLRSWLTADSTLYGILTLCYAPFTEEPAKWWILAVPWVARRLAPDHAVIAALAIGTGFGIGEAWMLADLLSGKPAVAAMPWYQLNGFINERFLVCVCHSAFVLAVVWPLLARKHWYLGMLIGLTLHLLGNLPLFLAGMHVAGWSKDTWGILILIWVQVFALAMIGGLIWVHLRLRRQSARQTGRPYHFMGWMRCPSCAVTYPRPLFGFQLFTHRYERCGACHHWRLVPARSEPPPAGH